jgi:hypothetical protein
VQTPLVVPACWPNLRPGGDRSAVRRSFRRATANGRSHAHHPNGTLAAAYRQFSDGVLGRATLDGVIIEPPLLKGPSCQAQTIWTPLPC